MAVIPNVIKIEIVYFSKKIAFLHQRENFPVMAFNQIVIRCFSPICFLIFHAVFFGKAFYLTMPEHRKTRHCYHECTDTEILVAFSELSNGSFFVRVIHKVDKAAQYLRVKFKRVFDCLAVFVVFLFFEHVHKRAVVNAVHTERAHKIAFHHPESFCKQQCIRYFFSTAVDNLAPEFIRNTCLKFIAAQCRL